MSVVPFGANPTPQSVGGQPQPIQIFQQPQTASYPWPGAQTVFNPVTAPSMQTMQSQFQQVQKPVGLPGKMVSSQADITPNDVPMDGRVSLFPQQDYSCIIAKAWNAEGKIDTVVYVPQKPETAEEIQNGSNQPSIQDVLGRIQNLEDLIANLPKTPGEDSLKSLLEPLTQKLDTIIEKQTPSATSNLILK